MNLRVNLGKTGLAIALAMGCSCAGAIAEASPRYPSQLRAALGLTDAPRCTLCHSQASDAAAQSPVDTPFGMSLIARGLLGETVPDADAGASVDAETIDPTLLAALAAMRRDDVDSDGDGAQDLDELSWGADPNVFDGFHSNPVAPPQYGCEIGRRTESHNAAWFIVLGSAVIAARRRIRWHGRCRR